LRDTKVDCKYRDRSGKKKWAAGMARRVVKNYVLDQELADAVEKMSAARRESQSLIVREILRLHFKIGVAQ
jgi:hypothetical protein